MTNVYFITNVEEEISFHQLFSISSSNVDFEGELLVYEDPAHASLEDDVQAADILDVLKAESKCERFENALTDSDLIPSTYSYMFTSTLLHSSTEAGDTAKVLIHCELLFLTFGPNSTCFGSDFRSEFMSKDLLKPLFIILGAATTFSSSKFQDNSDLLGADFTFHGSKLIAQAS